MATIQPTITWLKTDDMLSGYGLVQWGPMANGDDGAPVELVPYDRRSVQVTGTLGAGGNAQIQGSNDSVNYAALATPGGATLDINALAIKSIGDLTRLTRPKITAGDGTTALTVTMLIRTNPR